MDDGFDPVIEILHDLGPQVFVHINIYTLYDGQCYKVL